MTLLTNSQNTYAQVGIKEDLQDMVYRIDPEETPFQSNINTALRAKQTLHEWQTQPLAAQSKTNFNLEGDDSVSAAAATARIRLKNYCAISKKTFAVSGTANAVDVAGVSSELDEQTLLKGIELKRDMELILVDNNAHHAGGTTTARECAGLAAFITNTDTSGMGLYSASAGTGADAWNLGSTTSRALTLTILNAAMKEAYIDGGKPSLMLLSPTQKQNFSGLAFGTSTGGVQIRYNTPSTEPTTLIGSVENWTSDYGKVQVAIDVQFAGDSATTNGIDDTAYLIDTRHVGVAFLRPMFEEDLAKTGDNTKRHILAEYTLVPTSPKAHAALFALT